MGIWTNVNKNKYTLSRVIFQFIFFGSLFFVEAEKRESLPSLRLSFCISSLTEGRRYYPSQISLQKSRLSARYVRTLLLLMILLPFVLCLFPLILFLSFVCFDKRSELRMISLQRHCDDAFINKGSWLVLESEAHWFFIAGNFFQGPLLFNWRWNWKDTYFWVFKRPT